MVLEKTDHFTPQDAQQNLVVMMLMLPSAARQNKEVLKVFKDSGCFAEFFPGEENIEANKKLLNQFPNLDYFGDDDTFYGKIVKTSLGNTLRIHRPLIIIDEGHKAYSDTARDTIHNLNPSLIVELSATPPKNCNTLANISGTELNREEMIKLDMHITTKISPEWQDTMRASMEKRDFLGRKAREYESNTGEYIRPICLIQVERTGKEQRSSRYIHAEDVKEYLIKQCGIEEAKIAIKSSEKDDIEGIDLFGRDCKIKYIITKHALQEGWDCSFAYILTILTNPTSQLSITQLVGRVLRQPFARKTHIKELDESYMFCFQQRAKDLLQNVREGLAEEGLGDLAGHITVDAGDNGSTDATKDRYIGYRGHLKKFEGKIYLPKIVVQENTGWRDISYEMDIISQIDYHQLNLKPVTDLILTDAAVDEQEIVVGLSPSNGSVTQEDSYKYHAGGMEVNTVFVTRQIIDLVPNPWQAHEISSKIINTLSNKHDKELISNNLVYILEELRKQLEKERDRQAEKVFRNLIETKKACFFLLADKSAGGYKLPIRKKVKNNTKKLRLSRDFYGQKIGYERRTSLGDVGFLLQVLFQNLTEVAEAGIVKA